MITKSKVNIFLAHTEYHLICSLNLALTSYTGDEYENHIYYSRGAKRLNYELKPIKDLNGFIQPYEANKELEQIKLLQKENCNRFFFFQENSILNKYLASHLKIKGAIICLAPDGSKPYGEFSKNHETLSMIIDTFCDYVFLLKKKLILPKFILSRYYRYGSSHIIDEVWLQNPELFNYKLNKTKGKLMRMPLFEGSQMEKLAEAFCFKADSLLEKEHIILYINQPFWSEKLVQQELYILNEILKAFPTKTINIKLHPNTPQNTLSRYSQLERVTLINENYPAEFYISMITKSIIFSGWSTALMHYSKCNNYYYLYPNYKKLDDKILNQIKLMPFQHIQIISSIKEMNFPN